MRFGGVWLGGVAAVLLSSLAAVGVSHAEVPAEVEPAEVRPGDVASDHVRAAESQAPREHEDRRRFVASRRSGPVVIDGVDDEAAWQTARARRGFWQRNPREGEPPRFDTEFRILYDDEALFVVVHAFDPDPGAIRGLLTRRDQESSSDWVSIALDSYADRRTAFEFSINPAGVQRDQLLYDDVQSDASWDAVWDGAARVHDDGWVAEFRIPYTQLRFSDGGGKLWGLQVSRTVDRMREETMWAPWPKSSGQRVSLFGRLDGLDDIVPPRRLELLPYIVGGVSMADGSDALGFEPDFDGIGNVGLDLAYGLGSNFTLSGTINPDFGQVESDPSEVNLGTSETFLNEKRPFFLEGTDIFKIELGEGEQLFYSRRIGAPPSDPNGLGDGSEITTIYGAAKLSGKTADGWSLGMIDAVTAPERIGDQAVEPLTNYGILRVKKDLRRGKSSVGGIFTSVHRALGDGGGDGGGADGALCSGDELGREALRCTLHAQAYGAGLSLTHRFAENRWQLDGTVLGSQVRGSPEALAATQQASQRYYQRPDADHLDLDPTRTSLSGIGSMVRLRKIGGDRWRGGAGGNTRSPGFEINDVGFQQRADFASAWGWLQRRDSDLGRYLRFWELNLNTWGAADFAPDLHRYGANVNGFAEFRNYWYAYFGQEVGRTLWDTRLLRGGPSVRGNDWVGGWMGVGSDSRKSVRGSFESSWSMTPASDSWRIWASATATVQALENLELSVGPSFTRRVDDAQYVGIDESLDGDDHYLLARIDQITTALTLRLSYTFSPALSLQVYAQPFVSTGRYNRYKEVNNPRAAGYADRFDAIPGSPADSTGGAVVDETIDGSVYRTVDSDGDGDGNFRFGLADFSARELNSNVVLRWEYMPGSALFFIWSHNRADSIGGSPRAGRYDADADLGALANESGEHVVLFKLSYWFTP